MVIERTPELVKFVPVRVIPLDPVYFVSVSVEEIMMLPEASEVTDVAPEPVML